MNINRLKKGGLINRDKVLKFTWNNKKYLGYEGDTLASALLANDIKVVGRSFKYHRPRGVMSSGVEESGALLTIGQNEYRDPNVRATSQELYDGLVASGQNAFPSVNFDFGGVNNMFKQFLAAGFYYKTFMGIPPFEWGKGTKIWMFYEKFIRKAAGMGAASRQPDPERYEHAHDHCDILIIGSGPAGIAAATRAAEKNLDVILVEQDNQLGGSLLAENNQNNIINLSKIKNLGIRVMTRTTAFGLYDGGVAGLLEKITDHQTSPSPHDPRQRFWIVRAKHTVLATGSIERHIAFGNNDLPGVMTAFSSRTYLNRYAVLNGK